MQQGSELLATTAGQERSRRAHSGPKGSGTRGRSPERLAPQGVRCRVSAVSPHRPLHVGERRL